MSTASSCPGYPARVEDSSTSTMRTVCYAELNLNSDTSTGCGRVSMVRFVNGIPQPPQVLGQSLSFPDGVTVVDSAQIGVDFMKLPVAVEPDPSTCNGS